MAGRGISRSALNPLDQQLSNKRLAFVISTICACRTVFHHPMSGKRRQKQCQMKSPSRSLRGSQKEELLQGGGWSLPQRKTPGSSWA